MQKKVWFKRGFESDKFIMDKKLYCLGIRLNDGYTEVVCKFRLRCRIFRETNLTDALLLPDFYQEVDSYNNEKIPCDLWQK